MQLCWIDAVWRASVEDIEVAERDSKVWIILAFHSMSPSSCLQESLERGYTLTHVDNVRGVLFSIIWARSWVRHIHCRSNTWRSLSESNATGRSLVATAQHTLAEHTWNRAYNVTHCLELGTGDNISAPDDNTGERNLPD